MEKKYTLARRWVVKNEVKIYPQYFAYDIYLDKKVVISKSLYYILLIFKHNILSINELYDLIGRKQKKESLINMLFKNAALIDILEESPKPYSDKDYTETSNNFVDKYNIVITNFPLEAEIHLTEKCNLKCKHCCYECSNNSSFKEIELSYWLNLFEEFEQNGFLKVAISGGELFLYPYIFEILKDLSKRKFRVELLTNAILIKKDYLPYLCSPNIGLNISLDGAEKEHHEYLRGTNTFEPTLKNIRLLSNNNATINISTTIHKQNLYQVEKLVKLAIENKVNTISFILLDKIGRAKENKNLHLDTSEKKIISDAIKNLQESYKNIINIGFLDPSNPYYSYLSNSTLSEHSKIYCSAATNRIAIAANGDVFPCVYAYEVPETIGGNITQQSILDIWETNKWDIFRGKVILNDLKDCKSCSLLNECSLKICRLKALVYSNDFYGMPHNCPKSLC